MKKILLITLLIIGLASFSQDKIKREFLINSKGEEVDLGIKYIENVEFDSFKDGYGVISMYRNIWNDNDQDYSVGLIDSNANWIIKLSNNIESITTNEGFAVIKLRSGTSTLFDLKNQKDMAKIGQNISGFSDGLCSICNNGDCETIDKSGKIVFRTNADKIKQFSNGYAAVFKNNRGVGYIDKTGKMVINADYYDLMDFSADGFAFFQTEFVEKLEYNKEPIFGIIDNTGKVVVKPTYENIRTYPTIGAKVKLNGKFYNWVTPSGKKIKSDGYDYVNGYYPHISGDYYGLKDVQGNTVFKPKYERIEVSTDSDIFFLFDKKTDKGYYVDKTGNKTIETDFGFGSQGFSGGFAFVEKEEIINLNSFSLNADAVKELQKIKDFIDNINDQKRDLQTKIDKSQKSEALYIAENIQSTTSNFMHEIKKYKATPAQMLIFKIKELKSIVVDMSNLIPKIKEL